MHQLLVTVAYVIQIPMLEINPPPIRMLLEVETLRGEWVMRTLPA